MEGRKDVSSDRNNAKSRRKYPNATMNILSWIKENIASMK
jgi:hypothetical protein